MTRRAPHCNHSSAAGNRGQARRTGLVCELRQVARSSTNRPQPCEDNPRHGDICKYSDKDPSIQNANIIATIQEKMKSEVEGLIDSKLRAAMYSQTAVLEMKGGKCRSRVYSKARQRQKSDLQLTQNNTGSGPRR